VPYEEIARELAGGEGATTVAALVVGTADLLAPARRAVACEPGCDLPLSHVRFEGLVRDVRVPPRLAGELPWRWEQAFGAGDVPVRMSGTLDLPADRRHDPHVRLDLTVQVTAGIFDAVNFASLGVTEGILDLGAAESSAAREAAQAALSATALASRITRSE
jgi:hypothetical protein